MKKIFIIFLSLALISFAFASCVEETSESSVELSVEENHLTSSEESRTADENSEESSEESIENTKPENIMYNPDPIAAGGRTDEVTTYFRERFSADGFADWLKSNDFEDDIWFCVEFDNCYLEEYLKEDYAAYVKGTLYLRDYLESKGVIIDEELTNIFIEQHFSRNKDNTAVGYINQKIYLELAEDNYAMEYAWLGEGCLDGEHGNGSKGVDYCN